MLVKAVLFYSGKMHTCQYIPYASQQVLQRCSKHIVFSMEQTLYNPVHSAVHER